MDFQYFDIDGIALITPRVFHDDRGYFFETYRQDIFAENGISDEFVQHNTSHSLQNVLRGLHYQKPPHAQAKLVRCTYGTIYDVAVDIRPDSQTYGRHIGVTLSAETGQMLYIPEGFAHGFYVISETADLHYLTSHIYTPSHDAGIHWADPAIAIDWPLIQDISPIVSPKDAQLPLLAAKI